MKELSIFVDESGDFGAYEPHCPYYFVTMVFHDQSKKIEQQLHDIRERLQYAGFNPDAAFHAMPIIRREGEFRNLELDDRRKLMAIFLSFVRKTDINYHSFGLQKHPGISSIDMTVSLSKQFVSFFTQHRLFFHGFDRVVVYYDNGQIELTKILISTCTAIFPHFEYKQINPSNYRLFQAADFFCTFSLISMKFSHNNLSRSEQAFFKSRRDYEKNYLKALRKKDLEKGGC